MLKYSWEIVVHGPRDLYLWSVVGDRVMTEDEANRWCYWWSNKYPDFYWLELRVKE